MTTDTPRADDFPRIGCVQHDCDACATRAQEFVQLAADLAACRAALRELMELKSLKDRLEEALIACPAIMTPNEWSDQKDIYIHRNEPAWAAARAILPPTEKEMK